MEQDDQPAQGEQKQRVDVRLLHLEVEFTSFWIDCAVQQQQGRKGYQQARSWLYAQSFDFVGSPEQRALVPQAPVFPPDRSKKAQEEPAPRSGSEEEARVARESVWMQVLYDALRSSYYGKFNLPPFETLAAAFYEGNERVLSDWSQWIETCTRWPTSTFFWTTDDPPFFASVGNPYGTIDTWIWFPEDRLEIWFRQGAPPLRSYGEQLLQQVQAVALKTAIPFLEIDYVDTTGGVHSRQFQQGKRVEETS